MIRMLIAVALAAPFAVATSQSIAVPVTLTEWKVELGRDTVPAGSITFRVSNKGTITHGLYVRGAGVNKGSRDLPAGESALLTLTLKPGTYEVFCPLSENSHKQAGMVRTLVVTEGAAPAPASKPER
jgi:plastocyanin